MAEDVQERVAIRSRYFQEFAHIQTFAVIRASIAGVTRSFM